MPWAKLDDQFATHAKVVAAGNTAVGCWVRLLTWSAANCSDGAVPLLVARLFSEGSDEVLAKLVEVGMLDTTDDGYAIHDYLDWNPSASHVAQVRRARAKSGSIGGKQRSSKRQANCSDVASTSAKQNPTPSPSPSPSPVEREGAAVAGVTLERFGEVCAGLGIYGVGRSERERFSKLRPVEAADLEHARAKAEKAGAKTAAYLLEVLERERAKAADVASRAGPPAKARDPRDWTPEYLRNPPPRRLKAKPGETAA